MALVHSYGPLTWCYKGTALYLAEMMQIYHTVLTYIFMDVIERYGSQLIRFIVTPKEFLKVPTAYAVKTIL